MSSQFIRRQIVMVLISLMTVQGFGFAQSTLRVPANDIQQQQQQQQQQEYPQQQQQPCVNGNCSGSSRSWEPSNISPNGQGSAIVPPGTTGTEQYPSRGRTPQQMPGVIEPLPESEFQDFVTLSVGRKLPIYGHGLFDRVPSTFAPLDRVPVTADYVVGPGDELLIRAWGQIDLDAKLVVDRNGEVYLPKLGAVQVAGVKYHQLPEFLKTTVGRVFRNFQLTVSLGQLRSIDVFVVGQARRPGTYTVSSLSTLVNALFASGGPSISGSMRHIQLKRDDHVVTEFDLYDLLLKGDKSKDAKLLPGDVIYVPPVGPSIAMAGSVRVPSIYELRDHASLREAIEMAGGLTTMADGQKAVVERIENRTTRKVEEFSLDNKGFGRKLKDGDVVRLFSLSPRFDNAVTLRGNVARPGRYEWHAGMHIKDLIPNLDALMTRDYWRDINSISTLGDVRNTTREREMRESFEVKPGEQKGQRRVGATMRTLDEQNQHQVQLQPQQQFSQQNPQQPLTSANAATEATTSEFRNEIKRNVPEINWDYAVIQRLNPQDLSIRLVPFNLGKAVLQNDQENNIVLEPGDILTIFSQADLSVPIEKQTKFVRLEGEFHAAGVYKVEPGETLRQLVERVGGLTPRAYFYGAEFTRESVRVQQQKGLDQLVASLEHDVARTALAPVGVNPEDAAEKKLQIEAQRDLVEKLRQVKATGRVVLELKPDANSVDVLPEMTMEDGDRFLVPYRPSTVDVIGAVYNRNSFLYRNEHPLADYLKRAGGVTRDADKGRIFVIRADGSVLSKQTVGGFLKGGFDSLRLMPGDAVVVPERLAKGTALKSLKDWTQVFSQFALGAAAVQVLKQ